MSEASLNRRTLQRLSARRALDAITTSRKRSHSPATSAGSTTPTAEEMQHPMDVGPAQVQAYVEQQQGRNSLTYGEESQQNQQQQQQQHQHQETSSNLGLSWGNSGPPQEYNHHHHHQVWPSFHGSLPNYGSIEAETSSFSMMTQAESNAFRNPYRREEEIVNDPLAVGLSGTFDLGEGRSCSSGTHVDAGHQDGLTAAFYGGDHPGSTSFSISGGGGALNESTTADESAEESEDDALDPPPTTNAKGKKISPAFQTKGRKKRNKCSPEQLQALEAFFAKNRNPTGRIREELSKKLRMPERSVQVWFQNRRAKVKVLEKKGGPGDESNASPKNDRGNAPAEGSRSSQGGSRRSKGNSDASNVKQGEESVTALPATALCIGTWRRVSPLICFFSRRLQTLTWYLSSDSVGFKLEMPWTSVKSIVFDGPTNPSMAERAEGVNERLGHIRVELARPPTFFMQVFRSGNRESPEGEENRKASWRQCADFTENRQATAERIHIVSGPYVELREAVVALSRTVGPLSRLVSFNDVSHDVQGFMTVQQTSPDVLSLDLLGANQAYRDLASSSSDFDRYRDSYSTASSTSSSVYESPQPMSSSSLSQNSVERSRSHHSGTSHGSSSSNYLPSPTPTSSSLAPHQYPPPASGLSTSFDLTGLRIDTQSISSFNPSKQVRRGSEEAAVLPSFSHYHTAHAGSEMVGSAPSHLSGFSWSNLSGSSPHQGHGGGGGGGTGYTGYIHPASAPGVGPQTFDLHHQDLSLVSRHGTNVSGEGHPPPPPPHRIGGTGMTMPPTNLASIVANSQQRKMTMYDIDFFSGPTPTVNDPFSSRNNDPITNPSTTAIHPDLMDHEPNRSARTNQVERGVERQPPGDGSEGGDPHHPPPPQPSSSGSDETVSASNTTTNQPNQVPRKVQVSTSQEMSDLGLKLP
ncbi:hypothetical protein IE53DRAFT_382641 [Violaceomyces palustris]|uniref:Uncharacterized protein n=1 Tax=Violaceomyces palustris TaxID=1673888 RepID=A0ACD0NLR3_9BASI|nr:hypothetical protein IE53DRAFT_382641 [Violaceomyces palustris]